jgi:hypothetical protein
MNVKSVLFTILMISICGGMVAQPVPGDVFKEYFWYNETGDCGGALRVGGNLDYKIKEQANNYIGDGKILLDFDFDLSKAIKAELIIEKMLCHSGTEGLRIIINDRPPVYIPEANNIPQPQSSYAHHFNQIVPIDLSFLSNGRKNIMAFEVDTAGHSWPQNLVYGVIFRIYYDKNVVAQKRKLTSPSTGESLGLLNVIKLEFPANEEIKQVDYIGYYDDVDLEGDGTYKKWHYGFHKGEIFNHIGSVSEPSFEMEWNTEWIPDQVGPIQIAGRVIRNDGYIYITDPIRNLSLERPGYSVELCKPYDQPEEWFTRKGEFQEKFNINGDIDSAIEAKMVFKSWSPGYFNGIYINDFLVFIKEGPKYHYYIHDIPLRDTYFLKHGENILKTGKTPRYHGAMVHGVEVQWPGIMLLIKYEINK